MGYRRRADAPPGNPLPGRSSSPIRIVPDPAAADDPGRQMKRIRSGARAYGLTIKTRRVTKGSAERSYSILDTKTGQSLVSNLPTLHELAVQLWWIIRQRRTDKAGGSADVEREACPTCGTVRVGSFRFCRSCGMDFEPARPSEPEIAAPKPQATIGSVTNALAGGPGGPRSGHVLLGRLQGTTGVAPSPRVGIELPTSYPTSPRVGVEPPATYPADATEVRRALGASSMTSQRIVRASRPSELVLREAAGHRVFQELPPPPVALPAAAAVRKGSGLRRVIALTILAAILLGLVVGWIVATVLATPRP